MSRLLSFISKVIIVSSLTVSAFGLTTGDLILLPKDKTQWPPMILSRPELECSYGSNNFLIHYDTTGDNIVYKAIEDIDPVDGVPDYINKMAEYLEQARTVYIDELEYDMPPPDEGGGGDDRYDIYVTTTTGLTVPVFHSDYYPERMAYAAYSYIGNDLCNENHPDNPYPNLMATCAHEYFHAVQLAYRGYVTDETDWWYELTAMWAEEKVFDDLNDVYYYLNDYYNEINHSLYLTGGNHMYGGWVWAEYLSQCYGDDIIKKIFSKLINFDNSLEAISATLTYYELDINTEYSVYACWNYFTGENYYSEFFAESEAFPVTVPLAASHSTYPVDWQDCPQLIENLGIVYLYFANPGYYKNRLVVDFKGNDSYTEYLSVASIYLDGVVELTTYTIDTGRTIEISVDEFWRCEGVVLAVDFGYLGYTTYDSTDYKYCAYLDTSDVAIDDEESVSPSTFSLQGNYPNPFNLSSEIIFYWNLAPTDYKITIYDLTGRLVDGFYGEAVTGQNKVRWTAQTELASGTYYYRITAGEQTVAGKMLLLK